MFINCWELGFKMGDIIHNIKIEELEEGNFFDKDELIIEKRENRLMTIRREPGSDEIKYFIYDFFDAHDGFVHNNGYGEVYPRMLYYDDYKNKLMEKGLW